MAPPRKEKHDKKASLDIFLLIFLGLPCMAVGGYLLSIAIPLFRDEGICPQTWMNWIIADFSCLFWFLFYAVTLLFPIAGVIMLVAAYKMWWDSYPEQ